MAFQRNDAPLQAILQQKTFMTASTYSMQDQSTLPLILIYCMVYKTCNTLFSECNHNNTGAPEIIPSKGSVRQESNGINFRRLLAGPSLLPSSFGICRSPEVQGHWRPIDARGQKKPRTGLGKHLLRSQQVRILINTDRLPQRIGSG